LRTAAPERGRPFSFAGAPSLSYKTIVEALDAAKGAGVDRVGIITAGMRKT
jgi:biopolymer transport protein ExbD